MSSYTFHVHEAENQDYPKSQFHYDSREEAVKQLQFYLKDAFSVSEDYIVYAGGHATLKISENQDPDFDWRHLLTRDQLENFFT